MHTNGNGDWVILDELGPPWPIHSCYYGRTAASINNRGYENERKVFLRVERLLGTPKLIQSIELTRPVSNDSDPSQKRQQRPRRRASSERPVDIERYEPRFFVGRGL